MPAFFKNARYRSGHSAHPYKISRLGRPEFVYRVFQLGTAVGDVRHRHFALDCAAALQRPMSRPRRSVA
jgi:hypothetical protein